MRFSSPQHPPHLSIINRAVPVEALRGDAGNVQGRPYGPPSNDYQSQPASYGPSRNPPGDPPRDPGPPPNPYGGGGAPFGGGPPEGRPPDGGGRRQNPYGPPGPQDGFNNNSNGQEDLAALLRLMGRTPRIGKDGAKPQPLTKADPSSWKTWRIHMEWIIAMRHFHYNQYEQKAAVMALLQEDAIAATRGVNAQLFDDDFTVTNLLDRLEERFCSEKATEQAMSEFQNAAQKVNETIIMFHGRLWALHVHAYPAMHDDDRFRDRELINRFRFGIRDKQIVANQQFQRPTTWREALLSVTNAEAGIASFARISYGSSRRGSGIHSLREKVRKLDEGAGSSSPNEAVDSLQPRGACYNCKETGHHRASCPHPAKRDGRGAGGRGSRGGRRNTPGTSSARGTGRVGKSSSPRGRGFGRRGRGASSRRGRVNALKREELPDADTTLPQDPIGDKEEKSPFQ